MSLFRERADIRWARLQREARGRIGGETAGLAAELVRDLTSLIDALDRCAPRLAQVGEAEIARETSRLCARAAALLRQIDATGHQLEPLQK